MSTIVVQTIAVYLFLLWTLYTLSKKTLATDNFKYVIWGIFIYSVFFGLRYGVGTDCISYINNYEDALKGFVNERHEAGFTYLQSLFVRLGLPSFSFLVFVSFIQLFLIFNYFKDKKYILPFLSITFMLGCVWLSYANGMRQITAFCLFVLSLKFAEQKNWKLFLVVMAVATTIHTSALLLVPLVPFIILDRDWTPHIGLQYLIFITAIVLGQTGFINNAMESIDQIATLIGYDEYLNDKYSNMLQRESIHYGIGYFINLLIPVVLIFYSGKLKKEMPAATKFYNLYFVGLIIRFAFFGSSLIQRVNYYFYGFDYIIGAIVLFYLWSSKNKKGFIALLTCYLLVFVATMYRMFENDSAFYFLWQIDDYLQYTFPNKNFI